jgi:para-nitrobenzyl esterase
VNAPAPVTLDTELGRLAGLRTGRVARYAGIPYAHAPIGARRFRAPEPCGGWTGERDATEPAAAQPQSNAGPELVPGMVPARVDDDSLTLTVWTPGGAGPHPVLVWVHGGSFMIGAASLPTYDATRLAADGDVVVVGINYRVGALGFMTVGETANLGLLDQICALRWVRDHIGGFGGDPRNVTVFGESAGGGSILHLLAMPAARGLFDRAIVQSGSTGRTLSTDQAAAIADVVLAELGCTAGDAGALARLTSAEVVAAQERALPKLFGVAGLLPFHPALDEATLPTTPLETLRAGTARDVDLVLGVTTDEMRLFLDGPAIEPARLHKRASRYLDLDDGATTVLLDAYAALLRDAGEPAEPIDVWAALYTDKEMLVPAIAALDAHASSGGRTFGYRFDWPARPRADGLELRACHGVDIPFTFATFDVGGWDAFVGADRDPHGATSLSAALRTAWCEFARTGDPSHEGIGRWTRSSSTARPMMRLGRACGLEADPVARRLAALAAAGVAP